MRLSAGTVAKKHALPIGVWFKTALILALAVAVTTAYDRYYAYTNPYIRAAEQRIEQFDRNPDKPLVVAIGASLMMLGTPREWRESRFDWLRLIIQGSRLDDFAAVADDVIELKPDLVVVDLHQFIDKPYGIHLRQAFKRLLRAPLEAFGLIRKPTAHFDTSTCGKGLERDRALERIKKQFSSQENDIFSSSVLKAFMANDVPIAVIRVPMLADIESGVSERRTWLESANRDAAKLGLEIHDPGWRDLGDRYFCPDKIHMRETGEKLFSAWLAQRIAGALDSPE